MIASTSTLIRRDPAAVARFITDPASLLPLMSGLGRFQHHEGGEWDAFLDVGTVNVGGRVLVERGEDRLSWRSVRGTRHTFEVAVAPHGEHSLITMTMDFRLAGLLVSRLVEVLGRGIAQRHLEAAAQQVRHHLEFESRD